MWWRRKKLERLYGELAALAIKDRLHSDRPELTPHDIVESAKRKARQAELLAEIARLCRRHGR